MLAYCGRCGEKRADRDDWTLRNIAGETLGEITNVEHSKLWRTLKLLVFKPGELTREYWRGRRKSFLGPVKLYLVFFALSLLLYSIHQPTAVYDVRTLSAADPGGRFARGLERMATEAGMSTPQFAQEVNNRWQTYISWSQLLYPLFVALTLKALFRRRDLYFAEHLVFALHVLGFLFLSFVIVWPFYFLVGVRDASSAFPPGYIFITAASMVWTAVYLMLALRRAYGTTWVVAVVKGLVTFLAYFVASMICLWAGLLLAIRLTGNATP